MNKTKKFIEDEFEKYETLYWSMYDRVLTKEKELTALQNEVNSLKREISGYDTERKHFQELLNELNQI